jgi:hypothetical protein
MTWHCVCGQYVSVENCQGCGLAEFQSRAKARQTKVTTVQSKSLSYRMRSGGGQWTTYTTDLRYKVLQTGYGSQDVEVSIILPIKVHSGDAALTYWTSCGYSGTSFSRTAHAPQKLTVRGATADETLRKRWSKLIDDAWGRAAYVADGKYYRLKFEFSFVDDAAEACKEVACVETIGDAVNDNPTGTIDVVRWGLKDEGPNGPISHEVGHMLGNPDEYNEVEYGTRTIDWGGGYTGVGVMNNPDQTPLPRHYKNVCEELCAKLSITTDGWVLLDPNLSMDHPKQRKFKIGNHIWQGLP